ncbi:MAG TPA: nitronate monooxygenase [Myxococcota bacterium]|nr:nitronate monooxygenase [Myxococcota bacterium]
MLETAFTRLVGASVPIQCAAMPGVTSVELAAAVTNAGGVGMLPATLLSPEALESELERLARAARGPFGVNFLVPFLDREALAVAARRARIVECFYGEPDPEFAREGHRHGALVGWQVGSAAEAAAAERAGCDYVVAQGTEAGGHVRGVTSLLPLLADTLERVRVPIVAAGGLATARDLAAVLACGASGARLGTRFLATHESSAHPGYVESVLRASAGDTCLTEAFSGLWPNAPHRVLRASIEAAQALPEGPVGEVPIGGRRLPVTRFSVICPSVGSSGRVDAMALYAGESVANVTSVRPAAEIIAELVSGAEKLLRGHAGQS